MRGRRKMSTRNMQEDMTMNMKVIDSSIMIGYWTTTIIVTLELLVGGVTDLIPGRDLLFVGDPVALVLAHLGYPLYLLSILGVWRLLEPAPYLCRVFLGSRNGRMPAPS